jgi:uncharacterized membrane protein YjgN (DUF898 family)
MADEAAAETREGRVDFTGSRHELLGIITRGYALMLPTIGLYRFWQATWKRRFYWQNTVIDGDPLEYTGTASQLLTGFFFALAFFLPIYMALFYLSMQESGLVVFGYAAIGCVVWFLAGYAVYRARDFRLSRTLWRGIRFDQRGNAWGYAARRFGWSVLMVLTVGLVYPFMASSLWRYRWANTWYGDRKFAISGNWLVFAGPYYGVYFLTLFVVGASAWGIFATRDFVRYGAVTLPGTLGLVACCGCVVLFALSLAWYRTRTVSTMLSSVTIGAARLRVRIGAGGLFGQFVTYVVGIVLLLGVLGLTALLAIGGVFEAAAAAGGDRDTAAVAAMFQSSGLNVALLVGVYLVVLGAFGLLSEIVLGFGWWKLLARGAVVENPDSLRSVRAAPEDRSLIGEGLASALNVGAY